MTTDEDLITCTDILGNQTFISSMQNMSVNYPPLTGAYSSPVVTMPSNYMNGSVAASNYTITTNGSPSFDSDITIKGTKLSDRLDAIDKRLSILADPDPKKLEKYAALKLAYEKYKLLEALCFDSKDK